MKLPMDSALPRPAFKGFSGGHPSRRGEASKRGHSPAIAFEKLGTFLLPQHGGGPVGACRHSSAGWGKRAMTFSHRSAASPSLPSPMLGEGILSARSLASVTSSAARPSDHR